MAIGAISAARSLGLKPGTNISIVGHDGIAAGRFSDPPLSTMEIAAEGVGRRLAGLLIKRIGGHKPAELCEILPVRQVPRASHGSPPAPP